EEGVAPYLEVGLAVALVNAPDRVVVSGPDALVDALVLRLRADGVEGRKLHTSHAFHSPMMQGAMEPLAERLRTLELGTPMVPFLSNLTGTWIRDEEARDPEYWAQHLRKTVRFAENVGTLLADDKLADGAIVCLEVGPGDMLTRLARRHPAADAKHRFIATMPAAPSGDLDDLDGVVGAIGRLWASGLRVDWPSFFGAEKRRRVSLPGYAFERRRYWIEAAAPATAPAAAQDPRGEDGLVKAADVADWLYEATWRRAAPPHFNGSSLVAGAGWLIVGGGGGLDVRMAEKLRQLGQSVRAIPLDDGVDPAGPGSFRGLVNDLAQRGELPRYVVYLGQHGAVDDFDAAQARGLYGVLHLVQALEAASPGAETDLL
ncbi:MAG: acyltransferase domain-containing protein, partial [Acidobacteriota bacterium]